MMMSTLAKLVAGGAATAVGLTVGKDVVNDVKDRYRRAKLRRDLSKARGENSMTVDELADLKRKLRDD